MLETGILKLDFIEKSCEKNKICLKKWSFIKYSHFDKYGNVLTIKHTVESINKDEVVLNIEKISHDGIEKESIVLDKE